MGTGALSGAWTAADAGAVEEKAAGPTGGGAPVGAAVATGAAPEADEDDVPALGAAVPAPLGAASCANAMRACKRPAKPSTSTATREKRFIASDLMSP